MKKHKFKSFATKCLKTKKRISKLFKKRLKFLRQIIVVAFFLGINIVLGSFFIENNKFYLPVEVSTVLEQVGIGDKEKLSFLGEELLKEESSSLEPQIILEELNKERLLVDAHELEYSEPLASAAAILLKEIKKNNYDLEEKDFLDELKGALKVVDYKYLHVSHNILIGPLVETAVVDSWFSDEQQTKFLKDDDFIEVGFATEVTSLDDLGIVGIVVQILGKPMKDIKVVPKKTVYNTPQFPVISDEEVLKALNDYRLSHDVPTLNVDDNLCSYASKRVGDLIAFEGLDNHAGFSRDFEDPENIPEVIKSYDGTVIAENLAHQYCKNMTTGDSFIAQTGTSIIEWCFDSSIKGHREAQLNSNFENACVRHGENMYVVIFGD
jgi:uncharacterized protein YkwD